MARSKVVSLRECFSVVRDPPAGTPTLSLSVGHHRHHDLRGDQWCGRLARRGGVWALQA